MRYVYPAIITKTEEGYDVMFPDVPGCFSCGKDLPEAIYQAEDALALMLYDIQSEGKELPSVTDAKSISCPEESVVTLVYCDTIKYQKMYEKKAVKKTLSIPNWLNVAAEAQKLNFSKVLQEALMEKIK